MKQKYIVEYKMGGTWRTNDQRMTLFASKKQAKAVLESYRDESVRIYDVRIVQVIAEIAVRL